MFITKARLIFFLMLTTSLIYLVHKFYYEDWSYYYRYQTIPLDNGSLQRNNYKIILLWTSYQGNWRGWSGGLGHDQIISNCKNTVMNGDCILTSNKNYIASADVVLFSLQDLKQVWTMVQICFIFWYFVKVNIFRIKLKNNNLILPILGIY